MHNIFSTINLRRALHYLLFDFFDDSIFRAVTETAFSRTELREFPREQDSTAGLY
jgi:hypothetical protein